MQHGKPDQKQDATGNPDRHDRPAAARLGQHRPHILGMVVHVIAGVGGRKRRFHADRS